MICYAQPIERQHDELEQLGLTLSEREMVKDSSMAPKMVSQLLECGISITEYYKKPWMQLKLSEKKWLKNRCRGLSDDDMQPLQRAQDTSVNSSQTDGK